MLERVCRDRCEHRQVVLFFEVLSSGHVQLEQQHLLCFLEPTSLALQASMRLSIGFGKACQERFSIYHPCTGHTSKVLRISSWFHFYLSLYHSDPEWYQIPERNSSCHLHVVVFYVFKHSPKRHSRAPFSRGSKPPHIDFHQFHLRR